MEIEKQQETNTEVKGDFIEKIQYIFDSEILSYFFYYLYENHTCIRCIFRALKVYTEDIYVLKDLYPQFLKKIGEKINKDLLADYDEENIIKKSENSHCSQCFGILQNIDKQDYISEIVKYVKSQNYEFESWKWSIQYPHSLRLRSLHLLYFAENQMIKALDGQIQKEEIEKVLSVYVNEWKDGYLEIRSVVKYIATGLLEEAFEAKFIIHEGKLQITLDYNNCDDDLCYFQKFSSILLALKVQKGEWKNKKKQKLNNSQAKIVAENNQTQQQNQARVEPTKHNMDLICGLSKQYFLETALKGQGPLPTNFDTVLGITIEHDSILITGNYIKYARYLPQTRFLDLPTSVADEINNVISPYFEVEKFNFMGGGREDVDVRMLGDGRPFILELFNPKKAVSGLKMPNLLPSLQEEINKKKDVNVTELAFSGKECWEALQNAQEDKIKAYSCKIQFENDIDDELIKKLDDVKELKVMQKTPIRVLHRRSPLTREKTIHALKVYQKDKRHAILFVLGSAGTYIKEFVHGDLERTLPNVGTLTQNKCDIYQLDVIGLYGQIDEQSLESFYKAADKYQNID